MRHTYRSALVYDMHVQEQRHAFLPRSCLSKDERLVSQSLEKVSKRLGYTFKTIAHLELALTHRSVGSKNNERLEFLGDSIVNFVIGEALFRKFPSAREGQLSRLRARLVKGKTLAEVAREFDLGEYLHLGAGEMKSGGHRRESILADAMEAVIGAIYLDGGLEAVQPCILRWYQGRLDGLDLQDTLKDPKTRLQEALQARQWALPQYTVVNVDGDAHDQTFTVSCYIEALDLTAKGRGSSRRYAEQHAAEQALTMLDAKIRS